MSKQTLCHNIYHTKHTQCTETKEDNNDGFNYSAEFLAVNTQNVSQITATN